VRAPRCRKRAAPSPAARPDARPCGVAPPSIAADEHSPSHAVPVARLADDRGRAGRRGCRLVRAGPGAGRAARDPDGLGALETGLPMVAGSAAPETIHDFRRLPRRALHAALPRARRPAVAAEVATALKAAASPPASTAAAASTTAPGCRCCTCTPGPTCPCCSCPCSRRAARTTTWRWARRSPGCRRRASWSWLGPRHAQPARLDDAPPRAAPLPTSLRSPTGSRSVSRTTTAKRFRTGAIGGPTPGAPTRATNTSCRCWSRSPPRDGIRAWRACTAPSSTRAGDGRVPLRPAAAVGGCPRGGRGGRGRGSIGAGPPHDQHAILAAAALLVFAYLVDALGKRFRLPSVVLLIPHRHGAAPPAGSRRPALALGRAGGADPRHARPDPDRARRLARPHRRPRAAPADRGVLGRGGAGLRRRARARRAAVPLRAVAALPTAVLAAIRSR